jgi:hypothetical protein
LKTPIRITKTSEVMTSKTLTLSATALNNTALTESGLCNTYSTNESFKNSNEDITEKLLKAYKKKKKVRRIKTSQGASSTMYGKIQSSKRNRIQKVIADSGTGIPIIPVEIATGHGSDIQDPDPDEPGCHSASGHDMKIVGQTEFWVKFENMKNPKKIHALVAEQAAD